MTRVVPREITHSGAIWNFHPLAVFGSLQIPRCHGGFGCFPCLESFKKPTARLLDVWKRLRRSRLCPARWGYRRTPELKGDHVAERIIWNQQLSSEVQNPHFLRIRPQFLIVKSTCSDLLKLSHSRKSLDLAFGPLGSGCLKASRLGRVGGKEHHPAPFMSFAFVSVELSLHPESLAENHSVRPLRTWFRLNPAPFGTGLNQPPLCGTFGANTHFVESLCLMRFVYVCLDVQYSLQFTTMSCSSDGEKLSLTWLFTHGIRWLKTIGACEVRATCWDHRGDWPFQRNLRDCGLLRVSEFLHIQTRSRQRRTSQ